MKCISRKSIHQDLINIFLVLELNEKQAKIIINNLINSELLNKKTHGLILLTHIIPSLINKPTESVFWNWSSLRLHCTSNNHLGYLILGEAIDKICTKAVETKSIAFSTIAKISHAGRLGHYSNEIAKNNLMGIVFAHSNPWVSVPSGKKAVLGSVAFSASIPFTKPPLIIDFTPNIVTAGEVRLRSLNGEKFDIIIGIDSKGNATNDPNKVLNGGALNTIGEHKGFVIALLISIISTMIGGDAIADMKKGYGYFALAIHPEFLGIDNYIERCQKLVDEVKNSGEFVHLPGSDYQSLNDEDNNYMEVNDKVYNIISGLNKLNTKEEYLYFLENFDKETFLKK